MNKPERPELFSRAQGFFRGIGNVLRGAGGAGARAARTVGDVGGQALKGVGDASARTWEKATYDPDEAKRRRRKIAIVAGGLLAAMAFIFVVSRVGDDENLQGQQVSSAQTVSVVTVQTAAFQPVIALNGEARPVRDIQVAAPATGVRILQLLVDEGDTVRAGQPMARLDTALSEAQTRAAQASVAEAESSAVRARGEYRRADAIRDSGALSAEAIEQRRAAAIAAEARLAAARAQLQEVNARLGGGYVRAPAAGLVIDRTAEVGRDVQGQVLFRIAADNQLEVAAQVAEGDALALAEGETATFTLVDGSTEQGTLRRLPASIDSRTRTGEALFTLPHGTRVRAGMFLRGEARLPPRQVLAVPQSSILYDGGQPYVFVVQDVRAAPAPAARGRQRQQQQPQITHVVHRANLALGARDGEHVEVLSGLDLNQRIVGSGAAFLQDGDTVAPLAATAAVPARTAGPALRGREG
jgi:RND family efflux transporter MFP subunit